LSKDAELFCVGQKTHILLPSAAINYCSPPKKAQLIFQRENPFGSPPKNVGFFPIYTCPHSIPASILIRKKGREKTEKITKSNLGTDRGVGGEKEKKIGNTRWIMKYIKARRGRDLKQPGGIKNLLLHR
jgi:hypothetical protein